MGLKTALISFYNLDETSGNRADAHNGNTLTDYNTCLYGVGKKGYAAYMVSAQFELLYHVDSADFSFGDESWSITGWIYLGVNNTIQGLITKGVTSADTAEYGLYMNPSHLVFLMGKGGTTGLVYLIASTFGPLSTSIWYFVHFGYDAVSNKMRISVNNGAHDEVAHTWGCRDGAGNFCLGRFDDGYYADIYIDLVGLWRRHLTAPELTWLYNGGAGRQYSDFPSGGNTQGLCIF